MSDLGNPFASLPPTDVKVVDVTEHEVDPRRRAQLETLGQKDAGFFSHLWSGLPAMLLDGLAYIGTSAADVFDQIMIIVAKFFKAAQGEKNANFWILAATIVEDLTGVHVDADALKQSYFGSGRIPAMQLLGADFYKLLEDEFKPASGNLEAGDAAPAQRFLGFLLNFAIRQGNIAVISEFLPAPFDELKGFREYGELMAKNLGLGRLARAALRPLVQTTVADPLMMLLNEKYRPKRMAKEQAIKRMFRDPSVETAMRHEMAQEGFSDARIQDLIDDARPLLAERQIIDYGFRFGDTSSTVGGVPTLTVKDALAQRGFARDEADRLIAISRPLLKENEIGLLFVNDRMDLPTALLHMGKLGYDDETAKLALEAHSLSHTHARHLGLAEIRKAFHNNVIDLLELKAILTAQGYSAEDQQIITLDLLQPTFGKVRQLSLAEIKAGFKAGALTEAQAIQHLKSLGYSDADVAVILRTLPAPKPPATPPAAPPPAG